jgi:MOSC domain-containing protein YiiM
MPTILAVARDPMHRFSKAVRGEIHLLAGLGVEGDAHAGETVRHRSRVAADPTQPNLRQVHLVASETLELHSSQGFALAPGDLGENVTTRGIDLFSLPRGTRIALGPEAVVEVTGLRNPCAQIEAFRPGLLARVTRAPDGTPALRVGIMGIVLRGGRLRAGDALGVTLPAPPHEGLARV